MVAGGQPGQDEAAKLDDRRRAVVPDGLGWRAWHGWPGAGWPVIGLAHQPDGHRGAPISTLSPGPSVPGLTGWTATSPPACGPVSMATRCLRPCAPSRST